jgi:hypothetical protein
MSDIFQEVDEEVRRDKAAEFWKKYQNLILAAAALVVLASAGFRYWQYEREKAQQAAGDQFQQALAALDGGKLDEAKAGFDTIAATGPSGYRALAEMAAAGAKAQSDPQGAVGAFDAVAGDAAIDPLLRDAARLRAGLLRGDIPGEEQKGEAALTALARTMTTPPSNSMSCWATQKSRPTSGNWRAAGWASSPRTDQRRRSSSHGRSDRAETT